jgi:hypothetical protein
MNEKINEASIEESFYHTNDHPGYNLRSKTATSKPLLSAPGKKKDVAAKQPVVPAKKISNLEK